MSSSSTSLLPVAGEKFPLPGADSSFPNSRTVSLRTSMLPSGSSVRGIGGGGWKVNGWKEDVRRESFGKDIYSFIHFFNIGERAAGPVLGAGDTE